MVLSYHLGRLDNSLSDHVTAVFDATVGLAVGLLGQRIDSNPSLACSDAGSQEVIAPGCFDIRGSAMCCKSSTSPWRKAALRSSALSRRRSDPWRKPAPRSSSPLSDEGAAVVSDLLWMVAFQYSGGSSTVLKCSAALDHGSHPANGACSTTRGGPLPSWFWYLCLRSSTVATPRSPDCSDLSATVATPLMRNPLHQFRWQ